MNGYHLVIFYNIPNGGSTSYQQYSSYSAPITNPPPTPQYAININNVFKTEIILIGTDCGFPHANDPLGHMENGVWKFVYDINYTKTNSSIPDNDIYWEWVVADETNWPSVGKQFLVYPYNGTKYDPLDGEKKLMWRQMII